MIAGSLSPHRHFLQDPEHQDALLTNRRGRHLIPALSSPTPSITTLPGDWFQAAEPSGKLLVVLHGRGDSSQGFHWLPSALRLHGLDYLMPNAPDDYYGGRSWYDLPPDQEPGVLRSRKLLDQLFEELLDSGRDAADIALLGFSQGCLMTLEWGTRSDLDLAAYIGISGYCLDPASLLQEATAGVQPAHWLITHGTHDDVLPLETTRQQIQELADGGLEFPFEVYEKGHTIDPHRELPRVRQLIGERLGLIEASP